MQTDVDKSCEILFLFMLNNISKIKMICKTKVLEKLNSSQGLY